MLFASLLKAQVMNGSFEEWSLETNGTDVPTYWDYLLPNHDDCIVMSEIATDGNLALKLSSLNPASGPDVGPAFLATKVFPTSLAHRLSFDYLIDSLDGKCRGVIRVWFRNEKGIYHPFASKVFNQISDEFINDFLDFELPYFDTLLIEVIAESHPIPFGYDGFISFIIDNIRLDVKSQIQVNATFNCTVLNSLLYGNRIYVHTDCTKSNYYYKIIEIDGNVIDQGLILGNSIYSDYIGLHYIYIYTNTGSSKIFKIINH